MQCVLIVDDIAENLYYLEVLLKGNGFAVATAGNGAEALEYARNSPPVLIVSDILMPVMDGYALCREWRADDRLKQIPFIFYTATFIEKKDEELAFNMGADRFVIKPQEPEMLMDIIHTVLADAQSGTAHPSSASPKNEGEILGQYNEVLFRKLEKKMAELERTNQALQESERYFRQFIMESPSPIVISGHDGTIELVNDRFVETTGYTLDDIPNVEAWWIRAYPDPSYRSEVSSGWQAAAEKAICDGGGVRAADEYNVTCKNGMVRVMEIYGATITNKFLVIFNDITERKKLELELQKKNYELEQFTYSISHDLRSPLVTIKTFSGYLDQDIADANNERISQDMQFIRDAADKMELMLHELLELSRIGRHENPFKTVAFHELVKEATSWLGGSLSETQAVVTVTDQSVTLHGDRLRLAQIWQNLLENALNYREKTIAPHIEIGFEQQGVETRFYVRDNGIGIAPEYHEKIFGLFEKLDRKSPGAGLGLPMVKRIVELNGGRIWVESGGAGHGTCFWFTLPKASVTP